MLSSVSGSQLLLIPRIIQRISFRPRSRLCFLCFHGIHDFRAYLSPKAKHEFPAWWKTPANEGDRGRGEGPPLVSHNNSRIYMRTRKPRERRVFIAQPMISDADWCSRWLRNRFSFFVAPRCPRLLERSTRLLMQRTRKKTRRDETGSTNTTPPRDHVFPLNRTRSLSTQPSPCWGFAIVRKSSWNIFGGLGRRIAWVALTLRLPDGSNGIILEFLYLFCRRRRIFYLNRMFSSRQDNLVNDIMRIYIHSDSLISLAHFVEFFRYHASRAFGTLDLLKYERR